MKTHHGRMAPSLAPSRGITAAGLFASVLALLATSTGAAAGTTERVSVDGAGNQGNNYSAAPALSADGRVRGLPFVGHQPGARGHQRAAGRVRSRPG
jgi:hypothetical protein